MRKGGYLLVKWYKNKWKRRKVDYKVIKWLLSLRLFCKLAEYTWKSCIIRLFCFENDPNANNSSICANLVTVWLDSGIDHAHILTIGDNRHSSTRLAFAKINICPTLPNLIASQFPLHALRLLNYSLKLIYNWLTYSSTYILYLSIPHVNF